MSRRRLQLLLPLAAVVLVHAAAAGCRAFQIEEATVDDIQLGFRNGSLTSRRLVLFYLDRIARLNPLLHAVIEVNPDALAQAARADAERRPPSSRRGGPLRTASPSCSRTTSRRATGSTRRPGRWRCWAPSPGGTPAWCGGSGVPARWCSARPTSTSGPTSAPSKAPAAGARVVARAGPICRTVADAVQVLDAIVSYDSRDAKATRAASKYIPPGGYVQFLKPDGLKGKRIGIPNGFFNFPSGTVQQIVYQQLLDTVRKQGAVVIENLDIANLTVIQDVLNNGQQIVLPAEFKSSLNTYLSDLSYSPVRSLAEIIAFNDAHPIEERLKDFGQLIFLVAENTTGIGALERAIIHQLNKLSADGLEKLMKDEQLDAIITPNDSVSTVLAIGGMPAITVPAGYGKRGVPFGICFGGLKGYEPRLIEMAYAFEQATKVRKAPKFLRGTF
ncbi:hypothetical protein DAI22_06g110800 [Oryza sativa Japonica Group]|nr:hypothetical protein DAI22_06g110800 [Oryza sativa Japonica Group]